MILSLARLELFHFDQALVGACGKQRGFVDQVGQVSTGEARSTTSNDRRVDVFADRHFAHVHLEDLFATADVWQAYHHLAIETTRTKQRRVEYVRSVGSSDDDDAIVHFEAVHLYQQLVEGLLTLVVTAAHAGATVATHSVDLVDEDDARGMLLGLLEHVAHTAGTDTYEHFHEVRTGNGEERYFRFAGNCLSQQGLTGTWRTYHQHTARNAAAQTLEFARITQELDQARQLLPWPRRSRQHRPAWS